MMLGLGTKQLSCYIKVTYSSLASTRFAKSLLLFTATVYLNKDCYLVSILNELAGNSFMVFCDTCNNTQRYAKCYIIGILITTLC